MANLPVGQARAFWRYVMPFCSLVYFFSYNWICPVFCAVKGSLVSYLSCLSESNIKFRELDLMCFLL